MTLDPYDPSTYFDDTPMRGSSEERKDFEHDKTVTDGTYEARVVNCGIFIGKNTQQFHCSWYFEILKGEHEGKIVQRFSTISPSNVWRVKKDFTIVSGRSEEPLWADLYNQEGNHAGPIQQEVMYATVQIEQRTKPPAEGRTKTYVDVYIDHLIEAAPNKVFSQADERPTAPLPSAPTDGIGTLPATGSVDFDEDLF